MDPIKTKLPFKQWFETVPEEKRDTANYRLRYAYENNLIPQEQLDAFVSDKDAHLMSAYHNPKTGNYDFIKSKNHPTHALELDWYNSKNKDARQFKREYEYKEDDSDFASYVKRKNYGAYVEPLENDNTSVTKSEVKSLPRFKYGVTRFKQEQLASDNTKVAQRRMVTEPIVNTSSEFLFTGPKKVVDTSKGKLETKVVGGFESKRNPNALMGLIDVSPEFELLSIGGGFAAAKAAGIASRKASGIASRKASGAIDDGLSKAVGSDFIKKYKSYMETMRISKLPESISEESFDALGSMRVRLKSSDGLKRAENLGIDANKLTRDLRDVKFVEDPRYYGYHEPSQNVVSIHKNLLNKREATRHELSHLEQNALIDFDASGGKTEIDNMLENLELRRTPDPKTSDTYVKIKNNDIDALDYAEKMTDQRTATNYFANGSEGREKHPFLGELQQYMMKKNIIPSESYVNVTPEMIKDVHASGLFDKNTGGEFLRLLRVMKPTDGNYAIISSAMNKMIAGSGVVAGAKAASSNRKTN